MKAKIFVLCLFITANAFAKTPDWVDKTDGVCSSDDICAVGSGDSLNSAKSDARANILKYFETNINSKFQSNLTLNNEEIKELDFDDLSETANGIIKGIKITQTHNDGKIFYALAVLNKKKAGNEIKFDMEKLDAKMQTLLEDGSPSTALQLEKMFSKREEMNKKHLFLTDKSIPEKVKYKDVYENKSVNRLSFYISLEGEGLPAGELSGLKNKLSSIITDSGNGISKNAETADRILYGEVILAEEYVKVEGFKKLRVMFRLESKNDGASVGVLENEYVETGRDLDQISRKTFRQFNDYLERNYQNLLK
jgi:hypothetical protein